MCVSISLTAQGTATFFNMDATPGAVRSGLALLKASLVLQIFFSVVFIGILILFHRRCSAANGFDDNRNKNARTAIFALYASATLILVRNIFRTVQIFSSPQSPAWTAEAYFWVFDATLLLVATLILNVWHPGKLLAVHWDTPSAA
jgi:RTA1 like protein